MARNHVVATLALGLALGLCGNAAQAATEQYYGRWTVSDEEPAYSSKGIRYKTIDVAPCGEDFCGISVGEDNSCGEVLFRFLTTHAADELLVGHGRWGNAKKKLEMYYGDDSEAPYMFVALGSDDMDLSGREGSIPTFQASYERQGEVACTTD
ncbi:hypothetical protein JI749_06430 [Devosia oryziradicis]|uniref:Alkaline proteinase inhibitor/ Outer membrane lipoprotein Omp19 domain-containing protein n=1 Tax=Devosia oryziradicis TaxID=2801335 RepID=A0ABX7C1V1_9HYPH|nr:hypothetical protein [Devosia oryziradicis]QQR37244.1 hypothetical protein JI749_06430 [Devosia oryziradicis]